MRVDTMRRVDYWIGVPLCFLLSLFAGLLKIFRPRPISLIRRVLFVELSEMGSAILVDPAMRKLQREANAELFFVIFERNKPSLQLLKTVSEDNIYTLREDNLWTLLVDTLGFLRWVRKRRVDAVIDLELFSRFTALLTGLSGVQQRVGFYAFHNEGLYRGNFLTHRVAYNPHIHIAKNFMALVNALLSDKEQIPYFKGAIGDDEIVLQQTQVEARELEELAVLISQATALYRRGETPIVLINPNASEMLVQRRWPVGNYILLVRRILHEYPEALVLITGAPGEHAEAENLRTAVGSQRCVNFAGVVRFAQLPALYWLSALMVTNDSGPAHFAAVTPLPTFVLFGPETPALYGALGRATPIYAGLACSPCVSAANHRKTACRNNMCLQAITPDQVFNTIEPVLSASA